MRDMIPPKGNIYDVPIIGARKEKAALPVVDTSQFVRTVDETKTYNKEIGELDPLYAEFRPLYDYVVRFFVREAEITDSGLFLGTGIEGYDYIPRYKKGASGQRYTQKSLDNPFKFKAKAIIVATPENGDPRLKPGTVIGIRPIKAFDIGVEETVYLDYECSFVHPEAKILAPPTNIKDQHYGYGLLPIGRIVGLI